MVNKNKYGSFTVKIKGEDTVINPLTQKDIAEGWRLVLPKVTSTRVVLSYGSRQIIKNKIIKFLELIYHNYQNIYGIN